MKQRFEFWKTIKIDKQMTAEAGIGFVLMNAEAWPEELREHVVKLRESWKRATGGLTMLKFVKNVKKVENIALFSSNTDVSFTEQYCYKKLAVDQALQRVCKGEELIGME